MKQKINLIMMNMVVILILRLTAMSITLSLTWRWPAGPSCTKINLERQREAGYLVSVPILSRCCAEARTFEEAGEMAADAIRAYRTQIGEAGRLR